MSTVSVEAALREDRFIAIIRTQTREQALVCARAARAAGVRLIEITFGTPDCTKVIAELASSWPDAILGAGTVMNTSQVRTAGAAGARFIVSPHVDPDVVRACNEAGLVAIPGASTPTEIVTARRARAGFVKVFPIATLGGAEYVRLVRGPLPDIPLVCTGGVRLEDVQPLLAAGAVAVGGTNDLFPADRVEAGDLAWLTERARAFRDAAARR
jgi:2-dehydro-3-deoxyphosphogluconate aldolase/(4S)-4-hydroxy-2-oxoglutarate aldolase